jgi:xylulokinase
MKERLYVVAYDIGTTGTKTCIFRLADTVELVSCASERYPLYVGEGGEGEQECGDWWTAMETTTRRVLADSGVNPDDIRALSFCSQMQGLVLVNREGEPLRRAMSYLDQRARAQKARGLEFGLTMEGMNLFRLLRSLRITGGVSASVKDPLWKYKWVEENEPELFRRVYKWLDVKEYLIHRCTGTFCMTEDSANATFLYDTRPGRRGWSEGMCRTFGVDPNHLPDIIGAADSAGKLTRKAAEDLGLEEGIPVFGGGGDASLLGLGAGCTEEGDTHVYIGTSGWVSTVVRKRKVDVRHFIASILGARQGYYNYFSEQETSGLCLEWVRDHLALDEIGIYLSKKNVAEGSEAEYPTLLDYLGSVVEQTEPGCGGVIFTPWLHGNRSPFEDPNARAMFFNIGLGTGKRMMIRSVVEGLAYHKRWMLECIEEKVKTGETIRFVGGGAQSDVTAKVLADILGRPVEAVRNAKNAGAMGAAVLCGIGLGVIRDFTEAKRSIPVRKRFEPSAEHRDVYDKNFVVFKELHRYNRKAFAALNGA